MSITKTTYNNATKPGATDNDATGRNGSRRARNRGNNNSQQKKPDKFTGLNKSELQGIVICDTVSTPTSRQYDVLYDALVVYGGSKNPQVRTALRHLKPIEEKSLEPNKPEPSEYLDEDGKVDEIMRTAIMNVWSTKAQRASKIFSKYEQDLEALFGTITGQLSRTILDTLEAEPEWNEIDEANDTIGLLKLLRTVCYRESHTRVNPGLDLLNKIVNLTQTKQDPTKSVGEYVDEVKIKFEVVKACGGRITSPEFTKYVINKLYSGDKQKRDSGYSYDNYVTLGTKDDKDIKLKKEINTAVDQAMLAMIIIKGSNDRMHRDLRQALQDSFARGHDDYPTTSTAALDMLNQYRSKTNHNQSRKPVTGNKPRNPPQINKEHNEAGSQPTSNDNGQTEAAQFIVKGTAQKTADDADTTEPSDTSDKKGVVCVMNGNGPRRTDRQKKINFCFAQIGERSTRRIAYSDNVFVFAQQHEGVINKDWILLDSQATCNVICNKDLLNNIRKHPRGEDITIHCNAGTVSINTVGDLPGFGTVWFHPHGIANCLSLALVSDKYRVTLDTAREQAFFVHKADGSVRRFDRVDCDLYACDITSVQGTLLPIVTVEQQKEKYSNLDVKRATVARKLQDTLGFPSLSAFLKMIDNNLIVNCPVTRRHVLIAEDIFGPNVNIIKGKTVRRQPGHVDEEITEVPPHILRNYHDVTLAIDIYHINGIKFFRSISRHLMFRMTTSIRDAKQDTLLQCIRKVNALYASRGFKVVQIYGDNEFACLSDALNDEMDITFYPVARGCHEPHIERDNRTSKERARCMFAATPFKRMPPRMIIEMVIAVDFWLNSWCSKGGVSPTIPPRQIITGIKLDAKRHCKFQFGDYILAHNETDNTMKFRANEAIYLRPTGHPNGGFYVFDLVTARRVHRHGGTLAHMTKTVTDRVEAIAVEQESPIGMTFGDIHNLSTILDIETDDIPDDDDASDISYKPPQDDASTDSDMTGFVSEESNHMESHISTEDYQGDVEDTDGEDQHSVEDDLNDSHMENTHTPQLEAEEIIDFTANEPLDLFHPDDEDDIAQGEHETNIDDDPMHEDAGVELEESDHSSVQGVETTPVIRRSRRIAGDQPEQIDGPIHRELQPFLHGNFFTAGYTSAVAKLERENHAFMLVAAAVDQYHNMEASKVTPQYHVSKGLKVFGQPGVDAVMKELRQLHDLDVISPCLPEDLSREEVKRALPYLMFLKRKRCGKIKGRGCADGRTQRDFISKDEASSPTVSLYALILTCVIDAIEARDVATVDIPGAFLQTPMPDDEDPVHLRLSGKMARLLASIDPETYNPCLIHGSNGNVTLYAKANKAIYGTLKAALLFWNKLSSKLKEWGFVANPYDDCTVNKMINGSQATIVWHVDDLKISHVDNRVVDMIITDLEEEFGKISPLTITRKKVHEYLGMTIDYSSKDKVKFTMYDYLEDIIANLPDRLKTNRMYVSPAATHLFEVNPEAVKLKQDDADIFHHYVAKLLFASKRARPDLQTAVAFLCTRVQHPDEDDWKKLIRVLGYLKDTIFLPLVLGTDGSDNIYWYVDASFAVHTNMRSHTGGMMTFGQGAAISMSTKQKINTKSSTEAEIVGVDDCLPFNIWSLYFLRSQGYHPSDDHPDKPLRFLGHRNILYQDNTSSIKLETNGKASSSKRTRHINIRYFLITDKVKKGEIEVEYCPTEQMLADYFTKPLQGSLFRRLRNAIMGITDADYLAYKSNYYAAKAHRLSTKT